ncbi:alpha-tubulin N-acetyltransferase 1 isoform X2 [Entelurus aequoreus]|uniref:alpha-tubulin N-acetyltransferase 1 isoform X2 n=1 Tax=Entelurus aequoreus TaxID=161455 RepID=UPI002B1CEB96|nr:alpha-tubulin N-acetyltransferase 1 isoform X2 [Entelurus aequoreus]
MEFPVDINQLFSERVTILDQTLGGGRLTPRRPNLQSQLVAVIDELGKASAKAQMLTTPVTSTIKLQSQQHQVYLMKDGESNGGRGVIVGFLKVGRKKLFLLDKKGVHVEAEPLCVLDFFIAQNLQRHGYGLELFNFMLQDKNLEPELMAFDRPSPKLLSFLAKHYCLTQSVPQVNHFVVFEGFFLNKAVVRQEQRTPPWPFAPPHSPQRSVFSQYSHSVGSSPTRVPPQALGVPVLGIERNQSPHFPLIERCRARSTSQRGSIARGDLHSRYMDIKSLGKRGTPLSGLRWGGERPHILGHPEAHKVANLPIPQSRLLTRPPLSTSKNNVVCCPTFLNNRGLPHRGIGAEVVGLKKDVKAPEGATGGLLAKKQARSSSGCSWTVGNSCWSAQQVKQMHVYRSTCPW